MVNSITGIFSDRSNLSYEPEATGGLKEYARSLNLGDSAGTGQSALGNYDFKSDPVEVISGLRKDFEAAADSLEMYFTNDQDVPLFKRKIPNIEFNVEAKEAAVKLMNALSADYDTRGKKSYLLTDDGKDLMKKLVTYLPLTSDTDDDQLHQAQNSSFTLLSKLLANTKSSGRLDTISRDLALRMQAPVYARDDVRKYNLALTLMRNLGAKEFGKPAMRNGEFINVYKKIQDAFSIAGDQSIGKEFAKNIYNVINPILQDPIDSDLERNLGQSVVNAIKEMRKQVWGNAHDVMLSSANMSKVAPKSIQYMDAGNNKITETLRDQGPVLQNLVNNLQDLYINNDSQAEKNIALIVRDLAYEPEKYAMMAADAKSVKASLENAISGNFDKVSPVTVPVASLTDSQKRKALEDMLLQSANRVKAAQDTKTALTGMIIDPPRAAAAEAAPEVASETAVAETAPEATVAETAPEATRSGYYSVAKVKLQSEIAAKMESLSSETRQSNFNIGGVIIALNKQELKDVSDAIGSFTLVNSSNVAAITTQRGEDTSRVTAKQNFLIALLNEDRQEQISKANQVINTESKAFDQIVQKLVEGPTGTPASNLTGIQDVATNLESLLTDGKLDLQKLANSTEATPAGATSDRILVDAEKIQKVLTETDTTEIAFQLRNDQEGKQLGRELLKSVQADYNRYSQLSRKALTASDNVINAVVTSLNKAGLTSVSHRILEAFHNFITNGDDSGVVSPDALQDALDGDNSSNGGLGNVAKDMTDYIGSKHTSQNTQIAMLKNEQALKLKSIASKVSFGKTSGMNDKDILDLITGPTESSVDKENAIANFIDFANDLYQKTKEKGSANSAFNISEEDTRRLLVVDRADDLALAERDVHLKKMMLTVLHGLSIDKSNDQAVVNAKDRLVSGNSIILPSSSDITKFSKEADRLATSYESEIGKFEFSTAGKNKFSTFDQMLEAEQNGGSSGAAVRPDANNLLKRMVKVFTGLFAGNRSDTISAYLAGLSGKLQDDSMSAVANALYSALQP